jgi:hypothetical protein
MADLKDLASRYGVMKAQDQNENLGKLAEMLGSARDIGNEYKVPSWVPLAGGVGAGDLLMGKTPEEIENWSYGNAPMQIPEMSNVPQFKRGRAQSLADALTTLAPGVKATEGLPAGLSFIGPKSRNWDKVAAELAAKKLDEGADPAEVWREHLIGRMPDKTLFSEISDKDAQAIPKDKWSWANSEDLRRGERIMDPVSAFLSHPELHNAYHGMIDFGDNNRRLMMNVSPERKGGFFGDDIIGVGMVDDAIDKSTAMHELQHAIQDKEGWGQGGDLGSAASFYIENHLSPKLKALNTSLTENGKLRDTITNEDEYAANVLRHKQIVAERDKLNDEISNIENNQAPKLRLYNRLTGEAQARATQDRLDMDMAQRRENYPLAGGKLSDIPLEDLIYKYEGNGPSLAIKGYHGSPHKFKEFDTAHMGTGEGGQAYGWGNYITEDPYVATTYSPQDDWMDEQLMNLYSQAERRQDYPSMEVYERYMMHERPNEVADYLKESYADYPEDLPKRLPAQKIGENLYKKQKGSHLYEVSMEFPKEREAVDPMSIEHFLDYDKPLSEQSDYVRNILQSHDPDIYHPEGLDYDPVEKGSSILQRFGYGKEGAQKLYELGIPGTTYMGEKAKVADPEGVRNFVTYSDEVPRVVTRNMNKVKPLTNEDRLNDLEKQMSAYMKTKRMPKGVDFKTGSDWYDWAYDKREALRQKLSNDDQGYAQGGRVDKDSMELNKPQRTPNHPTKSHIVKTMVDGKENIIRFGEQGAETAGKPKEGESDRMTAKRESFKARHAKNIAKGKSSAAYWADKVKWAEGGEVDLSDDSIMSKLDELAGGGDYAADLEQLKRAYPNATKFFDATKTALEDTVPTIEQMRDPDYLIEHLNPMALSIGAPEKTVNAYKLFRTKENDPNTLYPLFVNADKPVPMNEWVAAEAGAPATQNAYKVKSILGPLAYRPGWHAGDVPIATHIGKGGKPPVYRPFEHQWAEVEFPADVDWQTLANERGINKKGILIPKEAHITDQIPFGGFYRYKTSPNMTGEWLISGDMKVNKPISDAEVKAANFSSGLGIEDLPRFHEYLSRNVDNPEELARVINSTAGKNEYFHMLKSAKDRELDDLLKQYEQFTDAKALKALDARYNKYLKKGYAEGGEVDAQDDEGYADDLARLKKAYERSNFGPNDSVIASTIHHPIEAAKRYGQHLNDMYAIATDQLTDAELAAAKDAGYDEESYPLYAMEHPIFRTDAQKAEAGMEFAGLAQTGAMPFAPESAGGVLGTIHKLRIGDLGYDLRFDDRKLEQEKLQNMMLQLSRPENEKRIISLANYEGYPFVTSMSDRTNVGKLHYINDRPVDVDLQGGQDYMFNNPGQVWASGKDPVNAIMKYGKELSARTGGLDPLYMPWRMAPTGGDYANMTGETMLKYMNANMNKKEKRAVNKSIKDFIPDFKGIESEEGIDQFRNTPDKVRKELKNHLDTKYRNAGGISIGEARLAVADPSQLLAPDTGLQNVGQIFVGNPIIQESGHRAYPKGVPGQGLGMLDRDISAYELMPDIAEYRGLMDLKNPRTRDIRALQMKPYGGIITDKVLRNLGYAKGGEVKALHDKYEESDYGYGNRPDKTKKGLGYFGELERPDGTGVMTEYSIGVPINGEEMDVPTLVPTLTPDEIRLILHLQEGEDMPRSIVHKAIDHAHQRLSEGKPIFATEEDLYAHGGIVDVLHNDAIEQIMKAFMDSMEDEQEEEEPAAVSIQITTHSQPLKSGKIPTSIREAKHG